MLSQEEDHDSAIGIVAHLIIYIVTQLKVIILLQCYLVNTSIAYEKNLHLTFDHHKVLRKKKRLIFDCKT